jgi:hypothetical protein
VRGRADGGTATGTRLVVVEVHIVIDDGRVVLQRLDGIAVGLTRARRLVRHLDFRWIQGHADAWGRPPA